MNRGSFFVKKACNGFNTPALTTLHPYSKTENALVETNSQTYILCGSHREHALDKYESHSIMIPAQGHKGTVSFAPKSVNAFAETVASLSPMRGVIQQTLIRR